MIEKSISTILFDCTTLLYWNRSPVGIVRAELEIAEYLLQTDFRIKYVQFNKQRDEISEISAENIQEVCAHLRGTQENNHSSFKIISPIKNHLHSLSNRLEKYGKNIEKILKKYANKELIKSQKEKIQEELEAIKIPPITRLTRNLFDKETLFISGGLDWDLSNYSLLYLLKKEINFKFIGIFYDVIILRNPEWAASTDLLKRFNLFFYYLATMSDGLVTISEFSKSEFLKLAKDYHITPTSQINVLHLGSSPLQKQEESNQPHTKQESNSQAQSTQLLPTIVESPEIYLKIDSKTGEFISSDSPDIEPQKQTPSTNPLIARFAKRPHSDFYALYVSTLEIRKNHQILLEAWKILQQHNNIRIPDLVFVGMEGWGVEKLLKEIQQEQFKNKVFWYSDVTDEELKDLYQKTAFTLFPSFAEGWGLGAAESLSYGKVAIISNAPALAEATQNLMPIIDAHNAYEWANIVSTFSNQPAKLQSLEKKIKEQFKQRRWRDFAEECINFAIHAQKEQR
ncbi:hypothetical protein CCZ01_01050 [Helicobacter monodelphidis]|uniref:glycosyltransferase n=1 Tax=Helicobacter sp. 15-1451 TaxID=2004995 RepID=UPI000DCE5910|nr:glycosyltransferase [Helicobacter sp. 15-1451]RAX58814.1 hypothetical protein CCZ01_01050 [Helicobacter sp. 15-1451]